MKKCLFCIIFISFIFIQNLFSEDKKDSKSEDANSVKTEKVSDKSAKTDAGENDKNENSEEDAYSELPTGYRNLVLGMDFESAKEALKKDGIFGYRGERDISLLPGKNRTLIETSGSLYIKRAWFQFYENKLYIISIQMDTDKIDYYTVYTTLTEKYGEAKTIDPKKSIWKSESVSMILERPLIIKYIDMPTFTSIIEQHKDEKAYSDILREDFINGF